jgi:hypothetical protein
MEEAGHSTGGSHCGRCWQRRLYEDLGQLSGNRDARARVAEGQSTPAKFVSWLLWRENGSYGEKAAWTSFRFTNTSPP